MPAASRGPQPNLWGRSQTAAEPTWQTRAVCIAIRLTAIARCKPPVAWAVAGDSYFTYDDCIVFPDLPVGAGVTLDFLFANNANHLSPGYRFAHYVMYRWFSADWTGALAGVLAFQAASTILLQRVLSRLWGDAWWSFVLVLGFGGLLPAVVVSSGSVGLWVPEGMVPGLGDFGWGLVVQAGVRSVVVAVDVAFDYLPGLVEGFDLVAPDAAFFEL
jgi:hypothetical protein